MIGINSVFVNDKTCGYPNDVYLYAYRHIPALAIIRSSLKRLSPDRSYLRVPLYILNMHRSSNRI